MRAASACEIQSSGEPSNKCLDIDKIFVIPSNLDSNPNTLIGKEARSETLDGRVFWRWWWRRRLDFINRCQTRSARGCPSRNANGGGRFRRSMFLINSFHIDPLTSHVLLH